MVGQDCLKVVGDSPFHLIHVDHTINDNLTSSGSNRKYSILYRLERGKFNYILYFNRTFNYKIEWCLKNDSIYTTYYTPDKTVVNSVKCTSLSYREGLQGLEYFYLIPDYFNYLKEKRSFNKLNDGESYVANDSNSKLQFFRVNANSFEVDSAVWIFGEDIAYTNHLKFVKQFSNSFKTLKDIQSIWNSFALRPKKIETNIDRLNWQMQLSQLFGLAKYMLVDFWYIDCAPCRRNFTLLDTINYSNDSIVVVCVNPVDDTNRIAAFAKKNGYTFIFLRMDANIVDQFDVKAFPTTLVFDRDFNILFRHTGYYSNLYLDILKSLKD